MAPWSFDDVARRPCLVSTLRGRGRRLNFDLQATAKVPRQRNQVCGHVLALLQSHHDASQRRITLNVSQWNARAEQRHRYPL
jgi:hypothetical protein